LTVTHGNGIEGCEILKQWYEREMNFSRDKSRIFITFRGTQGILSKRKSPTGYCAWITVLVPERPETGLEQCSSDCSSENHRPENEIIKQNQNLPPVTKTYSQQL
jgi:hypothetical protein